MRRLAPPGSILGRLCSPLAALVLLAGPALAQPLPAAPYLWRNAVIGGGGFVTGLISHPSQANLLYARTDVGGAYRWEESKRSWIPLTDWLGQDDGNLIGIESLAVDPAEPNRLYLAVGTYSAGPAAILRSTDQGRSFQRTDVPFRMGANEMGRFNGERLTVDPNQGQILFFGSRRDGLWRSADRGASWQKIESFPAVVSADSAADASSRPWANQAQQPIGIVSVVFDPAGGRPGSPTPTLFVAVSSPGTNLYRSTDAGLSWQPLPHQPLGLRPNHMLLSPDRVLYFTYGKEPGPNTMSDGAVWKLDLQANTWTDITPARPADADQPFGYGAISVDARHPQTLMTATFDHWHPIDEIYRSTNGGATWTPMVPNSRWDYSAAPYTRNLKPHWIGSLQINPLDSDRVCFVTGYGVWCCTNVTSADRGRPIDWVFLVQGLEETVPLALLSPATGAHLLSGIGDFDGFRHDDLSASAAEGSFSGPRFSNTEGLALAAGNPQIIARTGTGRDAAVHAAISTDGATNWAALASEPPGSAGAGAIALSANGRTIVWTPRRCAPYFTTDRGVTWTACAGLPTRARVVADPVEPTCFYALDEHAGQIMVSTNGGAGFRPTGFTVRAAEDWGRSPGLLLLATPGLKGDLWLASRRDGLSHSTNAGVSFTKSDSIRQAYSLGFGKPAPARDFPALYLAGQVADTKGLFRSDDLGESWVRINDDQHQYGYMGQVTGDPRVYGRVYFATGGRGIIYGDPASEKAILTSGLSPAEPGE